MFKKRYITLAVLTFLVCILAASAASAADGANLTDDALAIDASDEGNIAIEEDNGEEIISSQDDAEQIAVDEDSSDDIVSLDETPDDLIESPDYEDYNVEFGYDLYYITPNGGYVDFNIEPSDYSYAYDFYLRIYDSNGNQKINKNLYSYDYTTYLTHYVSGLSAGTYTMKIINYADSHEFDSATLVVKVLPVTITTSGYYSSYYNSNSKYTVTVKSQDTGQAMSGVKIKIQFKKGGKTVTKYYTTGSGGKVSIVPPVGVGTWTATVSPGSSSYTGASKTNTIKITKAGVKIQVKKVSQYQGIKFKIKATVKSQSGKAVKEGKVRFKINHKTYTVSVKNGVAVKKLKINKVKKYKFTAKYLGTGNFKKSKTAKNKVVIKKRYKTKVILKKKNYKGKFGSYVTVKVQVRTKEGKKVKDGWVSFRSVSGYKHWAQVKRGKASITFRLNSNFEYYSYYTYYYKKTAVSKFKVKYEPSSYKYKCSASKKIKIKEKYKCPLCGKTKSHSHIIGGYYYYMSVS